MARYTITNDTEIATVKYSDGVSTNTLELQVAAITNRGLVRTHNEDALLAQIPDYHQINTEALFVVADGMGGPADGEKASTEVKETYKTEFKKKGFDLGATAVKAEKVITSRNQIELASNPAYDRSGSTSVALHLIGQEARFHHVGDSRLYRYRKKILEQLTEDHTAVWQRYKQGMITKDEIAHQSDSNSLTWSLGSNHYFDDTVFKTDLLNGDRYMLCSDGLWDMLTDTEIQTILAKQKNAYDTAQELVAQANINGGKDNITVIVVDYAPQEPVLEVKQTGRLKGLYDSLKSYIPTTRLKEIGTSFLTCGQGLLLSGRETFKNGSALLRNMADAGRQKLDEWFEGDGPDVSIELELVPETYSEYYASVAKQHFTSRQIKPQPDPATIVKNDQKAIDAVKKYLESGFIRRAIARNVYFNELSNEVLSVLRKFRTSTTEVSIETLVRQIYPLSGEDRQAAVVLGYHTGYFKMQDTPQDKDRLAETLNLVKDIKAETTVIDVDYAAQAVRFLTETVPARLHAKEDFRQESQKLSGICKIVERAHAVVRLMDGKKALAEGELRTAEASFRDAIDQGDQRYFRFVGMNIEDAYVGLARTYEERGNFSLTIKTLEEGLSQIRYSTELNKYKARFLDPTGSLKDAEKRKIFEEAKGLFGQKIFPAALRSFNFILTYDSKNSWCHYYAARTEHALGHQEQAKAHYLQATQLRPAFLTQHNVELQKHLTAHDYLHALWAGENAAEMAGYCDAAPRKAILEGLVTVGVVYKDGKGIQKDITASTRAFTSALAIDPTYVPALYHKGTIALMQKRNADAIRVLSQITLKLDSRHRWAHYQLGRAYDAAGKQDLAQKAYQQAATLGLPEAQKMLKK
ncbi:MAG: tetratricopeptide repeat protein [Candidatus Woesearchaeota archaeon]|jgi:protein phosphatase